MISRSILVAEDLDNFTDQGQRRGKTVRGVAKDFSKLLRENLRFFYVEDGKGSGHEKRLREMAREASYRARYTVTHGVPADEILKVVHEWPRPEMVVMGTHGHTGLEKIFEGSVAEKVLMKSERPVMVVGPKAQEKSFRLSDCKDLKILVPTDLTRASRPAEEYAMSLAARTGADLTFFHSFYDKIKRVHEASLLSGFIGFDMERIFQKMQRDASVVLDFKLHKVRRAMVDCDYVIAHPNELLQTSLLSESKKKYCLIVMGTHSKRNALVRAFLGSTARDTILKAEIPVVIVHTH